MLGEIEEGLTQLRTGLSNRRSRGANCYSTGIFAALARAEGMAGEPGVGLDILEEALAFVEQTDERYCQAELLRLQADLLQMVGEGASAEASYLKAIEVAQRQEARSWELRAVTTLARLWCDKGKRNEARELLAPIYGWFTEGVDTADLKKAKVLLDHLS